MNVLSVAGLIISVRKSLYLVEKLDEIGVQVEESLDLIDECYRDVSRHLKSPVLFDDPVVITMIKDVKRARDAMLLIANKMTKPFSNTSEDDLDEEKIQ